MVNGYPWPVKCMTKKHTNPDHKTVVLPNALSKLLPRLSFTYCAISEVLIFLIMSWKANSHPYNLMNLIPSMIYEVSFIRLSLSTFIVFIMFPFILLTHSCSGSKIVATIGHRIPGHPSRSIRMMMLPMMMMGATLERKSHGAFSSIMLKSLENMLIIFPTSCVLAVYWVFLLSLENINNMRADLAFPTIIGT